MSDRARRILLLLAVATALADSSVVTLALPDILRQFDVQIGEVARVLTSYNAILAVGAVPAAYIARRQPRAVAAVGITVFGVASAVCGLSGSFELLLAARCIQAVGGALLICAALELLRGATATRPRASWAAAGVAGAAVGPAVGGALTQLAGWEWIFLLQAPVAFAALFALAATTASPARTRPAGRPHMPALRALACCRRRSRPRCSCSC